ncbi:ribosomal-protein-alanine N-acetyltransferase [Pseudobutyrivibrio sp. YE44]|uniref:ribosomal protein S18-alanine N-acetyltransferase n=1 Tax=Pseudobutyrivibrio sp. YE44 TaxID=1520802 RepID=UPI00088F2204|nr:ribosomal protein S18-alanine N-acetyltransferase [Pseudobutyrivibrio sp. YE44]SDB42574.1 ribosomal-protein-alanine N-acetyltransferase [Pseudobutyrivibrio sp. YE44]
MALSYRFAKENDLQAIFHMEQASMNSPWSLKSYEEAFESDYSMILVAEQDGQLAGFSVFYLTPPEAELPDIVVDEAFRGNGVGRFLLEKSIEELRKKDVETIFLEVRVSNIPARTLYEHLGFEQIGVRKYFYNDPVEDAICMRADIKVDFKN